MLNKTLSNQELQNVSRLVDYNLLEPKIGESYKGKLEFKAILSNLNSGRFQEGLQMLEQLIQEEPSDSYLDGIRLKAEVYATFEYHLEAWKQYKLILKVVSHDQQSLFMTVILATVLGQTEDAAINQEKLRKANPQLEKKLTMILQFIAQYQHKTDFEVQINENTSIDVLAVYGFGLSENGTLRTPLKNRLEKAISYAERFPMADIIVSGGAVTTPFNEAIEMKKWLIQHGVKARRILLDSVAKDTAGNAVGITGFVKTKEYESCCVITSLAHLPRAWMSLAAKFQREQLYIPLYGAAYEAPNSLAVPDSEITLSYHTVLRAAGLFVKNDFEERSR